MQTGKVLLWVLGGAAVVGGVAYVMASKKTSTSTSAAAPNPSNPCAQAAQMAALAAADPAHADSFSGPYQYWAQLCTQQGGNPPPFPA